MQSTSSTIWIAHRRIGGPTYSGYTGRRWGHTHRSARRLSREIYFRGRFICANLGKLCAPSTIQSHRAGHDILTYRSTQCLRAPFKACTRYQTLSTLPLLLSHPPPAIMDNKVSIPYDVIPSSHPARTLVLCFDGTGDSFDADVRSIHIFPFNCFTTIPTELKRHPVVFCTPERQQE